MVRFLCLCRGCPRRHVRQRRTVRSGSQPGQRVDPKTELQEHTRYSKLTSPLTLSHHCTESILFLTVCMPREDFLLFSVTLSAATYVKVYVLENGVCLAKKKTKVVKKNLDPTYQQALLFDESPQGKVLQVWDLHPINQANTHRYPPSVISDITGS